MTFAAAQQATQDARTQFEAGVSLLAAATADARSEVLRARFAEVRALSAAQEVVRNWDHSVPRLARAA